MHKVANVLAALPKSAHPGSKAALAEIYNAEKKKHAQAAAKRFAAAYAAKFPKAVAKIVDDLDVRLAFYDFPALHWIHLRTSNSIESTFATVRHRTRVTERPGSRAAGLAMAFKLIETTGGRRDPTTALRNLGDDRGRPGHRQVWPGRCVSYMRIAASRPEAAVSAATTVVAVRMP